MSGIERALVRKLQHLHGFNSLDCHTEDPGFERWLKPRLVTGKPFGILAPTDALD